MKDGARLILGELWSRELRHEILQQVASLHELKREHDVRRVFELLDEADYVRVFERVKALDLSRRALGRSHVEDLRLRKELERDLFVRDLMLAHADLSEAPFPQQRAHAVPSNRVG